MSAVVISGNTSGSITLDAPAVAGTTTYTLAAVSGTISPLVNGTAQASTSGTSIDFTGIPSWVKRITLMFSGMSTNGSSPFLIQLGDSGGVENTGYNGGSAYIVGATATASTAGFYFYSGGASATHNGNLIITLLDGNTWAAVGILYQSSNNITQTAGSKSLSATLDRVRVTTVGGTDTFDAGSINIMYE